MLDGSPLLLAPNSLISAAEVIQDVLMHLRCHHRAIAVDDLTNVREQDPQGTVLAVHISEDVDPKMWRNRQICRPEQCSVGLGRLLLKVSDRSPATLPGSWSLIECFDAISDFQKKALWCQRFAVTGRPLRWFVGKGWGPRVGHRQSARCQHLLEAGQVRTFSAGDRSIREDDQVVEVVLTAWSITPPDVAPGPIDSLPVHHPICRSPPSHGRTPSPARRSWEWHGSPQAAASCPGGEAG